jgi:hypothetical protein
MMGLGGSNGAQTYTRRTQWITTAYALLRKLLWYIVGLGRVELPTSRLSGPLVRNVSMYVRSGFTRLLTSRHFRREREKAQKPPPARTQDVHAKARSLRIGNVIFPNPHTNPLLGYRFSKQGQIDLEEAVRREVRDFHFRRWN